MFKLYQFEWKGKNRFGQIQRGKVLAESRAELEQKLLQSGFSAVKIRRHFLLPVPPKTEEISRLFQQLGLLLGSHIPLKQALTILLNATQQPQLYRWLKQILTTLEQGYAFSYALEMQQKYLTAQEIQLIKMGEKSGNLTVILNNLAQHRIKADLTRQKVKKILFYPALILTVSLLLSLFLLLFIVPKFSAIYGNKAKSLPFITDILFQLATFLSTYFSQLLIGITIISSMIYLINKKSLSIKKIKHQILNNLPIFNTLLRYQRIIFFCQNCALMLNAHLRLDTILNAFLNGKSQDPILTREMAFCLTLLKQGYRLSDGLNPTIFENEVVQMIEMGEKSGKLAEMCEQISQIYQQKLDDQIEILSQLLEPMLMLIMGMIVGTILIALYLPIFDLGAVIE